MQNRFSMKELYPIMKEVLDSNGEFRLIPQGTSMLPLIEGGRDSIILVKPQMNLKKYDVPLYIRKDGSFVLHRIVGIKKDTYVLCGDNQFQKEYGIKKEQIVAVAKGFYRKEKYIYCKNLRYICYTRCWCYTRGIRKIIRSIKAYIFKIKGS